MRRYNRLNSSVNPELQQAAGSAIVNLNRAMDLVEDLEELLRDAQYNAIAAYEGDNSISVDYCVAMTQFAQQVIDATARVNNWYDKL